MSRGNLWRAAAVSAQAAVLMVTMGCGSPTAPPPALSSPTVPPQTMPAAPTVHGAIAGTVTINGEARPIVWVEVQRPDGFAYAFGTTIPSGTWEWNRVAPDHYDVVIKTPPGLTCDATRKPAAVAADQRTVVNFACVGDVKGSIVGVATTEFGTSSFAHILLTGPVKRVADSNRDGFFAFEDLPPGEYVIDWCNRQTVIVRDGATAFVRADCS